MLWYRCFLFLILHFNCTVLAQRKFKDAETQKVIPQQTDHRGQPLPYEGLDLESKQWFKFVAFNFTFFIELSPANGFISPTFHVNFIETDGSNTNCRMQRHNSSNNCYFKGHVIGDASSLVSVSLCQGMLGFLHTSAGDYVVEPSNSRLSSIHFIKSVPIPNGNETAQMCDARGSFQHSLLNNTLNRHQPGRRRKRSISVERHIEVMVVVDSKMARFHGKGLRPYVLTLMSTVALLYKHPSIGNDINIAMVKLVVLDESEDRDIIFPSASKTLRNFCQWQYQYNNVDDSSPYHHDAAILLTREDLCRLPKTCDTLGLAQLGMICSHKSSCAIVEDNGLSAAFTIAHELGHTLSMPHDDDNKCARYHGSGQRLHIMARILDYSSHQWSWSACSRHYITSFLDSGNGQCLLDNPIIDEIPEHKDSHPGQTYHMDRQCQLVFGRGAGICPFMPVCKRLWCTMGNENSGCRTQHMPWADGTPCGADKWCQHGQCVRVKSSTEYPIDGEWGKWQNYGDCSRTCGGGVRRSERYCDSPSPAKGGKYCVGKRVRYRSCNFQECPTGMKGFREEQCSVFNGKTFNFPGLRTNVKWTAFYDVLPEERCKLYCRAIGTSTFLVLKDKVIDGTPCGLDTFDVCVNGKCMPAGCDHRLNSKKKLDICGTCGGNNSTCQTVEGYYNKAEYGYHHIVLIPAGASNLDVKQFGHQNSNDDNYLALQDISGNYLLNGDFMVSMFPKTIQYGGAVLEYSGSDKVVERINTTKQLKKDLIVMVLTVGNLSSPDVTFKYTVSLENAHFYEWDIEKEWSRCSHVCEGQQYRRPICVHKDTRHAVSDAHCHSNQKPDTFDRMCNLQCSLSWQIVNKSECSANCGKGTRRVVYKCMQQSRTESRLLDNKYCEHLGSKPQETQECEGPCSNIQWKFGEWSECSQTCGEGVQTRSAMCVDFHNELQPEALCDASVKATTKKCNSSACPEWKVGEWTQCSVTCGMGERYRPYSCWLIDRYVDSRFCDQNAIPIHKEECHMGSCVQWSYGNWGPCSASCGEGYYERVVHCILSNGTVADDSICDTASKPSSIKECSLPPCPVTNTTSSLLPNFYTTDVSDSNFLPAFPLAWVQDDMPKSTTEKTTHAATTGLPQAREWKAGPWSDCSVTCGKGTRKRQLVCHDPVGHQIIPDSECDISLQPQVFEICEVQVCGQWKIGDWSECPVTCGEGLSIRTVTCIRLNGEEGDSHECDQSTRPSTERLCSMKPCDMLPIGASLIPGVPRNSVEGISYWRTGHWGECSKSCGEGRKRRQVACYDEAGHVSTQCSAQEKPDEISVCSREPCPGWIISDWSLCSHTCGGGIQIRSVHCQSSHRTFPDEYCERSAKPVNHQECNDQPCSNDITNYRWQKEDWSQCNTSCGTGFMHRHVYCIDNQHSIVPDKRCTTRRPRVRKKCKGTKCHYVWKTGDWSTCSEACGKGVIRRHVTCHEMNTYGWIDPNPVPQPSRNREHWCDTGNRPLEIKSCNLGRCERNAVWKVGRWNRCSHDCGKGKQRRRVQCFTLQGRRISSRRCERGLRPRRKRNCLIRSCAPITCDELYYKNGIREDGEYKLHIRGRTIQIYCADMNTTNQQHYVTLVSGERDNYSEIYDKRLINPETCPHGGSRQENCNGECINDVNSGGGLTAFYRIGINITSLQVLTHDFAFSQTHYGQQVPYGESGDCYSKRHCPQGRFSINLIGTGFIVSRKTTWLKQGNRPDSKIQRLKHGQIVQGRCGGYCGKCGPDSNIGLLLDVAPP